MNEDPNQTTDQAITERTVLAHFGLHELQLTCPKCGPRIRPFTDLYGLAHPSTEIGRVMPALRCTCGARPVALHAICSWVRKFGHYPEPTDLSWLLPDRQEKAA